MKRFFIAVLLVLISGCAQRTPEQMLALFGDPAPTDAATQSIVIPPETRWVNVTGGDTVKFVVGEKAFAWTFNVARTVNSFDLSRVAPPGVLDHHVEAYVAPDPKYIGADGFDGGK
ncbi:MAG TPA: CzcE family metal-binding protein [Noviherbaspirillum sp.]|uniref:CzcE family metal-binding protein n=1 Tax=Noviherbaspirillum sp. TaxID=1926288 RepID=UPI002B48E692|nr:CzcE family metal-binding protein [Noviherbaspirillum sp.]HJV84443.1 CzcE family metal-binding protein [Noviherbaspirillum sp.]